MFAMDEKKARLVAFYLPQYHEIPENNAWWGKGFTEWVNVRKAMPLFGGHNQPRTPLDKNYYDLSRLDAIERQVELAKSYGIYGFCHYHYWFDGKQLLETPTNLYLGAKHLDLKFCLAWANETWSRRWDGQDHHVLQLQTHEPGKELWGRHFDYLIQFWLDERAISIDNKPVFIIYRPHKIRQLENMLDYWQVRASKYGLDGIYFLTMKQFSFQDPDCLRFFDAIILFQPFDAMHSILSRRESNNFVKSARALMPESLIKTLRNLIFHLKDKYGTPVIFDYDEVWRQIIINTSLSKDRICPGAFVDWDNTARYGRRATVFKGADPDRFGHWLAKLISVTSENSNCESLIFINAWNEWAEGAYLEPDDKYSYAYLEAVKSLFT